MEGDPETPAPLWERVAWLAVIWALSVAALGILAGAMKLIMRAAGLTM